MGWNIVLIILSILFLINIYFLIRNNWVSRTRLKILEDSTWENMKFIPYDNLPSYNEMLWDYGFWRWDISYYLNNRQK